MSLLELSSSEDLKKISQALSGDLRLKIVELLKSGERNLNEIAGELDIPPSTATVNVKKLEEAGLIEVQYRPGNHGTKKICTLTYDRILINFGNSKPENRSIQEISMPLGHFSDARITPPCGICGLHKQIGKEDDLTTFFYPEKSDAQLIWFTTGHIEYRFPYEHKENLSSLKLSMEICSEVPKHNNKALSDITIWINNKEISTWRSPGDYGGKRGKLTPKWWRTSMSQYGDLVTWEITGAGSFCNSRSVSDISLENLNLQETPYISVKIGVKAEAEYAQGVNIYGKTFGNHPLDLLMTLERELLVKPV